MIYYTSLDIKRLYHLSNDVIHYLNFKKNIKNKLPYILKHFFSTTAKLEDLYSNNTSKAESPSDCLIHKCKSTHVLLQISIINPHTFFCNYEIIFVNSLGIF